MNKILASEIARHLGADLIGLDMLIKGVSSLSLPRANTLTYRTSEWSTEGLPQSILVLANSPPSVEAGCVSVIIVSHPRQCYADIVRHLLAPTFPSISPNASVSNTALLRTGVSIGAGVIIEEDVKIGEYTCIEAGAVIGRGSRIGARCRIGASAVIGNEGLSAFETSDGTIRSVRHVGRACIKDDVEIGALCAIARGTIDDTIIGEHTLIGPMVNVGHNAVIGARCQIAGRSHLSGSVIVEDEVRLWAGCTIKDGVRIGTRATVGMGALVFYDVLPAQTITTLPAIPIRRLANFMCKHRWRG